MCLGIASNPLLRLTKWVWHLASDVLSLTLYIGILMFDFLFLTYFVWCLTSDVLYWTDYLLFLMTSSLWLVLLCFLYTTNSSNIYPYLEFLIRIYSPFWFRIADYELLTPPDWFSFVAFAVTLLFYGINIVDSTLHNVFFQFLSRDRAT